MTIAMKLTITKLIDVARRHYHFCESSVPLEMNVFGFVLYKGWFLSNDRSGGGDTRG